MIEPSIEFELESGYPLLMPSVLVCHNCKQERPVLTPYGINPNLALPCSFCGSNDTERMAPSP